MIKAHVNLCLRSTAALALSLSLFSSGCGKQETQTGSAAPPAVEGVKTEPLKVERVEPSSTGVKAAFNVQPDGQAALGVFGTNLSGGNPSGGATVLWNGQPLETKDGGSFLAATVPAALYDAPGIASVTVRGAGGVSNAMEFTVYAKTGPAPKLTELFPGSTAPGQGFNVQPNGQSAMGVAGEGFLPGVTLLFDGKKLTTVFGKGTGLSAVVPAAAVASAGSHQVWAVNADGKASNKMPFKVVK